jgi:hypothetical protein
MLRAGQTGGKVGDMIAQFDRFFLTMTMEQAESASHSGDCSYAVASLAELPAIRRQLDKIGADAIRAELKSWGAWDEEELKDDSENRKRLVWVAAGNIVEDSRSR